MICGYTKTGKDMLCEHLNTGKGCYDWMILRERGSNLVFPFGPGVRVGFADAIKREVKKLIAPDLLKYIDLEKEKDTVLSTGLTFRQHCIIHGSKMKQEDLYYWCKLAFSDIIKEQVNIVTVSDWRYLFEYGYALSVSKACITMRVFRKDVPVPPRDIESEHSLEHVPTDFLVIPIADYEEEFKEAVKQFPYYRNYVPYHALTKNATNHPVGC